MGVIKGILFQLIVVEFGVVSLHMDLASCARVSGLIGCSNLDCRVSGSGLFRFGL